MSRTVDRFVLNLTSERADVLYRAAARVFGLPDWADVQAVLETGSVGAIGPWVHERMRSNEGDLPARLVPRAADCNGTVANRLVLSAAPGWVVVVEGPKHCVVELRTRGLSPEELRRVPMQLHPLAHAIPPDTPLVSTARPGTGRTDFGPAGVFADMVDSTLVETGFWPPGAVSGSRSFDASV